MLIKILKLIFASIFALLAIGLVGYTGIEVFSFRIIYTLDGILFGGIVITILAILSARLLTSALQVRNLRIISNYTALSLVFTFYCLVMINLLFTSRTYWYVHSSLPDILDRFGHSANLIPFKTILSSIGSNDSYQTKTLLGNLFLMTPMGFFLPIYIKKLNKFLPFILSMTLGLFLIELIQIVTNLGIFDIDDIILNLLGATLVFCLCRTTFVTKITNKLFKL